MKCLLIVYSYHHTNTLKIANEFANVLNARIVPPRSVDVEELSSYDLIGFGAGIDSGRHYRQLLELAERLPSGSGKAGFIFSTSAVQGEAKVNRDHEALRRILESKGYVIAGEFSCKGFNTNSFLQYIGGMNKGRPNGEDMKNANAFAWRLLEAGMKSEEGIRVSYEVTDL